MKTSPCNWNSLFQSKFNTTSPQPPSHPKPCHLCLLCGNKPSAEAQPAPVKWNKVFLKECCFGLFYCILRDFPVPPRGKWRRGCLPRATCPPAEPGVPLQLHPATLHLLSQHFRNFFSVRETDSPKMLFLVCSWRKHCGRSLCSRMSGHPRTMFRDSTREKYSSLQHNKLFYCKNIKNKCSCN